MVVQVTTLPLEVGDPRHIGSRSPSLREAGLPSVGRPEPDVRKDYIFVGTTIAMLQLHKFIYYGARKIPVFFIWSSFKKHMNLTRLPAWVPGTMVSCFVLFLCVGDVLNLIEYLMPSTRLKIHPFYYFYSASMFIPLAMVVVWYTNLDDKLTKEIKELPQKRKGVLAAMSILYVLGLMALYIFLKIQLTPDR
jgi:hypothetical protein